MADVFSGLASGVVGGIASIWENRNNRKAQLAENARNRDFQAEQNYLDWQRTTKTQKDLLATQQQYQKELFDMQNEYNLPSYELARLRAAGINPAALMSQGSSGLPSMAGNSAGVPNGPSVPSVAAHGVSPTAGLNTPMSSVAQMFSSIAQLVQSKAFSKKAGAETKAINVMLPEQVQEIRAAISKMTSEERLNEVTTHVKEFELLMDKIFKGNERGAEVTKLIAESQKLYADGKLAEAQSAYYNAMGKLSDLDYEIKNEQKADLIQTAKKINLVYDAEKKAQEAKASESIASAEEHKAGAGLKRQQTATEAQNTRISEAQADLMESTFNETVAARINELRREGKNTEKLEAEIDKLRKEIDWYDLDKWWSKGEDVAKALGVGFGTAIGLGKFKSLRGIKPIKGFSSSSSGVR